MSILHSNGYKLIKNHYGDRVAKRSGVPLINHIDEGLDIMMFRGASIEAQEAFCIHPLLQNDSDLAARFHQVSAYVCTYVFGLALEYRNIANAFLSERMDEPEIASELYTYGPTAVARYIKISPLPEVNEMLIADKVQNFKDFQLYHNGTHPRSYQLNNYFNVWAIALGLSPAQFKELRNSIC